MPNYNDVATIMNKEGLAVTNRFILTIIQWPAIIPAFNKPGLEEIVFKTVNTPQNNVGERSISAGGGVKIWFPGDRTYEQWTTTLYLPETYEHMNAIDQWIDICQGHVENIGAPNTVAKGFATLDHLSIDDQVLRRYNIHGLWPKTKGAVTLDKEGADTVYTFEVTWRYDYYTIEQGFTVSSAITT